MTAEQALEVVPLSKNEKAFAQKKPLQTEETWVCPERCASKAKFKSRAERRNHLMHVHKWDTERAWAYIPKGPLEGRKKRTAPADLPKSVTEGGGWACPVSSCEKVYRVLDRALCRKHLAVVHNWSEEEVLAEIPITKRAKIKAIRKAARE